MHPCFDLQLSAVSLWSIAGRACEDVVQEGMVFKGKYRMQSHGWAGPAYVLCSGQHTAQPDQHLSVKLFARGVDYLQEKALLETPTITLQEYLPGLHAHTLLPLLPFLPFTVMRNAHCQSLQTDILLIDYTLSA